MVLSTKWSRLLTMVPLSIGILAAAIAPVKVYAAPNVNVATSQSAEGRWTTGDLHVHTFESNDAQTGLETVLDQAFDKYNLDWVALTDHLRLSERDDEGEKIEGGPIPFSQGMNEYQVPKIKELQEQGKYEGKTIFSGFEWDMPTHEHVGVGIVSDEAHSEEALKAANQFEYLFTNRDASLFDPLDVAKWEKEDDRAYETHEDALQAVEWLKTNYPNTSYAILNHPSRIVGKYTISDIREFNDLAPNIMFGLEGMIGNQMEPDRGGYNTEYDKTNPSADSKSQNRSYGGVDAMVAKLGGEWDALLGEGRHIWNYANSDYHFKTIGTNSSGYLPGEYAKNYVFVEGEGMQAVLDGMRSGKSFAVNGDLIDALDFSASEGSEKEEMGGELEVSQGDDLTLTIRFKSPETNHYENPVNSGVSANVAPKVDHIDLIAGDITEKAKPGTDAYNKATNDSTKVIASFTEKDWTTDAEGYHVIKYDMKDMNKDQYFRLRGTNLGMNVPGETVNGEPQLDPKIEIEDAEERFNAINDRNYEDLWFYSNPIFVDVQEESKFTDIDTHWAKEYINNLAAKNVIQGFPDQSFRPEQTVTRAEFASMLVKTMDVKTTSKSITFADESDIPAWAKSDITAAVNAGLIQGYEEHGKTYFKPNQKITRAEMSVMIFNALKDTNLPSDGELERFKDADKIPNYAKSPMESIVSAGIMNGYSDETIRPARTATRAEAAKMLIQYLEISG
ncbi:S-layer homology domain-containing protein [Paenibacillus sp. Marseille-Q4541]|uniref:S-layer homology domain-containing protein n=1 Tax=Paenibacillus sp. Marseille-Q4541 TaxID=2831522 RepID=UPI001BABBB88|nr:S-layer homology domain-containing protein [Paenibacillus sp. Marseille-Q4541]